MSSSYQPSPTIVKRWNDVLLQSLELATTEPLKLGPPVVARALAMIYTAAFQAWAPFNATASPPLVGGTARRPIEEHTEENKAKAISYAVYRTAMSLMPDARVAELLTGHMRHLGLDPNDTDDSGTSAVEIGNKAAALLIQDRANDGANQSGMTPGSPPFPAPPSRPTPYADYTGYAPANKPALVSAPTYRDTLAVVDRWQPLSYSDISTGVVATPSFITPQWGKVVPFALASADQFRPAAPAPYTSPSFLEQAKHVLEVQANLTSEQKVIAEYWADGPKSWLPPGHWCEIAGQVSERRLHTTDQDVKLFFALGNALLDASISCWEAKVHYNYCRPITAIRWLFCGQMVHGWGGPGQGTVRMRGEYWRPFQRDTFPTPPFSEFTSGHSTFSMAAATVLKAFTGTDRFALHHDVTSPLVADPGLTDLPTRLTWPSFTEAAYSAGESRIFGGIHFYQGNVAGLDAGRKIGEQVWAKASTYF